MANYNAHVRKISKIEYSKARCSLAHKGTGSTEDTRGTGTEYQFYTMSRKISFSLTALHLFASKN